MRFGTWNVRSLYRAGSLTAAVRLMRACPVEVDSTQFFPCHGRAVTRNGFFVWSRWSLNIHSELFNQGVGM